MSKYGRRTLSESNVTDDLLKPFRKLNLWKNKGSRAPHKPLLAVWAIGRCLGGQARLASYELVEKELGILLRRFGPYRRRTRTDYPFWHLRNDGVWAIDRPHLVTTTDSGDAYVGDLRRHGIRGGFTASVFRSFRKDPALAVLVAESLLAEHFPITLHDAILEATSVRADIPVATDSPEPAEYVTVRRRRRDRRFRARILAAYAERCAVCAFAVRLDEDPLALEAAHIRWHEADGPSIVNNGLALCVLHHKLFDAGAFTLLPNLQIAVVGRLVGSGVDNALRRHDREALRAPPRDVLLLPSASYLNWHRREVFKEPYSIR